MGFSQVKGKMRKEKRISFGTFCAEYGRVKQKKKLYGIPYSFMTCPGIEPGFTP